MSRWGRSKEATDARKSTIGDLPTDIKQRILEYMPIQVAARTSILSKRWTYIWSTQPNLVFDHHFFQYVSNNRASAGRIIHKILMRHTGLILGFQLISREHKLAQSDVDQCITFLLENGVQKLTIDMANNKPYALPYAIFSSSTLTHLKLSRCIFELPDVIKLPSLVSLNLELAELASRKTVRFPHLPMLEILKINMSRICSYTEIFSFYHVAPMLRSIKHLYLAGSFLENSWMVPEPERLVQPLNLERLILYDLEISYKHIYCALCFLRISPKLYELSIRETVRVGDTPSNTTELLSNYFSEPRNLVNEALKMIKTVRLRKFKGSRVEMCLVRLLLAHSLNLEKMIIEQYSRNATRCNEHLKELVSFPRASPKAVLKYLESPSHETRKRAAPV
ncbi:F-box/FBD/LRR-repeat protein At1g13570 [Nicotiana tabacum]|uniref:F-box/FBD/LRR-repeat protein At1g13570 n=3 Tax=Nicotiana tabacum TaxID=4097 RepID=A0AC58TIC2_TOBAC|nr:PREDICTED: F-box/FBD/LRR-repeat protein At1g13570-like [Nicotiana tabacum]